MKNVRDEDSGKRGEGCRVRSTTSCFLAALLREALPQSLPVNQENTNFTASFAKNLEMRKNGGG